MMTEQIAVVCPTCCETFGIPSPPDGELPCEIDYDCEICCRPMVISLWVEGDAVFDEAVGLGD